MPDLPDVVPDPEDPTCWTDEHYRLEGDHGVAVHVVTAGGPPSAATLARAAAVLAGVARLTRQAADLVLPNYSRAHFQSLGVDADLLVDETADAVASALVLESAMFEDEDEERFELSFSAPWDDEHSFDVEFVDGIPITCSVNG